MKPLSKTIAILLVAATTPVHALTLAPRTDCPPDFNNAFEFPHLIINVDSSNPNNAPGTSYSSTVTSTVSSLFKFDVPSASAGKTCSLWQVLSPGDPSLSLTTPKKINYSQLNGVVSQSTTWNNKPGELTNYGTTTLDPVKSYLVATFPCPAGQAVSYMAKSVDGTTLSYFENSGGSTP